MGKGKLFCQSLNFEPKKQWKFTILSTNMEFSNQKRSRQIKRIFNFTGIAIVVTGLIFLWLKIDLAVLISAVVFLLLLGFSQFAGISYFYFSTGNGKIQIRYYPVLTLIKKESNSIEFPQQSLINFQIERSLGLSDLTLIIKTKRGVAEYPSISLAGLTKDEIDRIGSELAEIRKENGIVLKVK